MREEVMGIGLLGRADLVTERKLEEVQPAAKQSSLPRGWDPEKFARQQIHALVRQVFFSGLEKRVRQVVFSAIEPETEIQTICRRVGEVLAGETVNRVAVLGGSSQMLKSFEPRSDEPSKDETMPLRRIATQLRDNLWLLPAIGPGSDSGSTASLHSYLGELRREFEYSIVEAPPAGESNEVTAMAQFADGIILVLSAQRTRRASARQIKDALQGAKANILGTVLSDRMFPIPERIYRRL
jgi:hypothetical protein